MADMAENEVLFMGRITAGFTHELKNVLAIIKESTGLMQDLIGLAKDASFPNRERFLRALTGIQDQVSRGVELSTRLNRFAHSPDLPLASIELNDMLQQVALLSERFARLKGVVIKVVPSDAPVTLTISPIGFQMALFLGMEHCWNHMPTGGVLRLQAGREGNEAVIRFICEDAGIASQKDFAEKAQDSAGWLPLRETVAVLGGTFEWESSAPGFYFILPDAKEKPA